MEITIMFKATPRHHYLRSPMIGLTLGIALLAGCAGASTSLSNQEMAADGMPPELEQKTDDLAAAPTTESRELTAPQGGNEGEVADGGEQLTPQLIKQASLVLIISDMDEAVETIQSIVRQAQGDVLNLQDYRSPQGVAHQITLTVRVPQDRLEAVLADIQPLGTVQQQSLTAEDVSSQIVDLEARLRNLRKSESALLNIMERSGEIADVLEVSRELSQVRESIERIDAQQQTLKRRVAYSEIHLTLQSPTTTVAPLRPVGETLGNTWQSAIQSVKAFTVGGLKVALWLLAYSPYLIIVGLVFWGGYRLRHRRLNPPEQAEPDNR
jgi:hypothetical protein